MALFTSQEVLGLDIGRRFIKALAMRKGKAGIEVVNASIVKIEAQPNASAEEKDAIILEALSRVMAEIGKKARRVAVAVTGQVVFPRLVKLPPVAKGKLKQIVQYETQQQIPFSLDEVIWDYHLLSQKEKGEIKALILAVKKEIVNNILNKISPMKLEVEILDTTPLSIYNTLYFNEEFLKDKVTAAIDIGAQSADIIMVEDGEIAMMRPIPIGGDTLTHAIARAFEINFYDAEEMKERKAFIPTAETDISSEQERKIFLAIQPILEQLLDEIRRSIGYYRSQLRGSNVERLLLTGGGIQLRNLDSFIEENLRITVMKINPFTKIPVHGDVLSLCPELSIYSVALGLGLRLLGEGRININLLPDSILQRIEFRKKEPVLVVSFVLILLIVLVYAGIVQQKASRENVVLKGLNDAITSYTLLEEDLKPKREEKQKFLSHITQIEEVSKKRTFLLDILNEVAHLIPDGIILESFSPSKQEIRRDVEFKGPEALDEFADFMGERAAGRRTKQEILFKQGIKLEGLSPDFGMISNFISRLEASPVFKKVEVGSTSGQIVKVDKNEFVKFVILAEY